MKRGPAIAYPKVMNAMGTAGQVQNHCLGECTQHTAECLNFSVSIFFS
jgi:hypothetical protein